MRNSVTGYPGVQPVYISDLEFAGGMTALGDLPAVMQSTVDRSTRRAAKVGLKIKT